MIKVMFRTVYREGQKEDGQFSLLGREHDQFAYFPNYAAAIILISRWTNEIYLYAPIMVEEVPDDPTLYHADVAQYRHLWIGK